MKSGPDIAMIASLVGDPARANMLTALMNGRALTASELAQEAGITPQTASSHLSKLEAGGLIEPEKQGRHRYYRLTDDDVAGVLEGLAGLAARTGHMRVRTGPKDPALRRARICYDHLAGDLGHHALRIGAAGQEDAMAAMMGGEGVLWLHGGAKPCGGGFLADRQVKHGAGALTADEELADALIEATDTPHRRVEVDKSAVVTAPASPIPLWFCFHFAHVRHLH